MDTNLLRARFEVLLQDLVETYDVSEDVLNEYVDELLTICAECDDEGDLEEDLDDVDTE